MNRTTSPSTNPLGCRFWWFQASDFLVDHTSFFVSNPGPLPVLVVFSPGPVLGALVLVTVLYRAAAFTRKKISEMDDGVVSRGEALWDEISEEAENESLCLGLSFAAIRSISFFAIGAMPDTHFHVYSDLENADWHRGWMVPGKREGFYFTLGGFGLRWVCVVGSTVQVSRPQKGLRIGATGACGSVFVQHGAGSSDFEGQGEDVWRTRPRTCSL